MLSPIFIVKKCWLPLTLFIFFVITGLSLWPVEQLPSVPGTDKTHHFMAYAALAFPVALRRPHLWGWVVLLLVGWGGAIELIQPYVNRWGEWLDFAANSLGILSGVLLAQLLLVLEEKYLKGKSF